MTKIKSLKKLYFYFFLHIKNGIWAKMEKKSEIGCFQDYLLELSKIFLVDSLSIF